MRSDSITLHPGVPTEESDARDLEWFEAHRPFLLLLAVLTIGAFVGIWFPPSNATKKR